MERTEELKERIRQQPLNDRLEESRRRIGDMCSKGRCPKMTIPVQHDDDDFYINTTLADAQATIAALQARVTELEDGCEMMTHTAGTFQELWRTACDQREAFEQQLTQRTAEFQRHDGELQQICGQALGYPWFKDDQKNFPGATEKDGVCVGEHVGITIAQELADAYRKRTAELERVRGERDEYAHKTKMLCLQNGPLMIENHDMKKLIAALPKVEGEIEYVSGMGWVIKHNGDVRAIPDLGRGLVAALLQHRQGMEG